LVDILFVVPVFALLHLMDLLQKNNL